jgi:hypothetical protein
MLFVELSQFAKVIGIAVVLLTSFAIRYWLMRANKLGVSQPKVKLNANDSFYLDAHLPLYRKFDKKEKKEFLQVLTRILGELDFDCEREGLVSRDEGVAFTALYTLLIYKGKVGTQKKKIVVFTKSADLRMFMQGNSPVLMVDFRTIEQELEKINRYEDVANLPENLQNTLKNFNDLVIV